MIVREDANMNNWSKSDRLCLALGILSCVLCVVGLIVMAGK